MGNLCSFGWACGSLPFGKRVVVKRDISPLPESNHGHPPLGHLLSSLSYVIFMRKKTLHSILRGLSNFMYCSLLLCFKRVHYLLHLKLTSTLRLSPKQ